MCQRKAKAHLTRKLLGSGGELGRTIGIPERELGAREELVAARLVDREAADREPAVVVRELRPAARGLSDLQERLRQFDVGDPCERASGCRPKAHASLAQSHRREQVSAQKLQQALLGQRPAEEDVAG